MLAFVVSVIYRNNKSQQLLKHNQKNVKNGFLWKNIGKIWKLFNSRFLAIFWFKFQFLLPKCCWISHSKPLFFFNFCKFEKYRKILTKVGYKRQKWIKICTDTVKNVSMPVSATIFWGGSKKNPRWQTMTYFKQCI